MKKSILLFCTVLITLSLTAFSVINRNDSEAEQMETSVKEVAINPKAKVKTEPKIFTDFIYGVGPRFSSIKKSDIDKATSIEAFMDEKRMKSIVSVKSVSLIYIVDDKQSNIREIGYSEELTDAQLRFLQYADYSTNLLIKIDYEKKNEVTGNLEIVYYTPHLTIVPEKQAEYLNGKDALIDYLKENSIKAVARAFVDEDKLQPAKLFFTVTKNGTIENVRLDRSCNYPSIDKFMVELIKELPADWKPALNIYGEKVEQELVISFGLMGC